LWRVLVPARVFVVTAVGGIVASVSLADIGVVEATFRLLDPTSLELHFVEQPDGPEYRIVTESERRCTREPPAKPVATR